MVGRYQRVNGVECGWLLTLAVSGVWWLAIRVVGRYQRVNGVECGWLLTLAVSGVFVE